VAFVFARENSRRKTWYVGYCVKHRFVRKRIGRSKALAEKARGDIEARLERGEAGLLRKDCHIQAFFEEYLRRTDGKHSASYHNRNGRVIEQFRRFLEEERPSLTEEEARTLLTEANGWFRPVLLTALYTGLREGELINLEWDDVDFREGVIKARRKAGWIPKSSGRAIRERDVAIPRQLVEFLREYRRKSGDRDNRVFHNKDAEVLRPGLRKGLMRLTRKCGFPEVTQFHALRHTYATHLIKTCKDLAVAQEQLGHADIRTTMKYSDITLERKKKAACHASSSRASLMEVRPVLGPAYPRMRAKCRGAAAWM
jgi:integrase